MKRKADPDLKQAPRPAFRPAPNDPPPLAALSFIEQMLIWSMRLWVRQGQAGSSELVMLRDTWRLARSEQVFAEFDSCMTLLAIATNPPLQVGALKTLTPTNDEARILAVLRAFQQGDADQAKKALCARLPCAAVRVGSPVLETLARSLFQANHSLPARLWPLVEWDELGQLTMESDRISAIGIH